MKEDFVAYLREKYPRNLNIDRDGDELIQTTDGVACRAGSITEMSNTLREIEGGSDTETIRRQVAYNKYTIIDMIRFYHGLDDISRSFYMYLINRHEYTSDTSYMRIERMLLHVFGADWAHDHGYEKYHADWWIFSLIDSSENGIEFLEKIMDACRQGDRAEVFEKVIRRYYTCTFWNMLDIYNALGDNASYKEHLVTLFLRDIQGTRAGNRMLAKNLVELIDCGRWHYDEPTQNRLNSYIPYIFKLWDSFDYDYEAMKNNSGFIVQKNLLRDINSSLREKISFIENLCWLHPEFFRDHTGVLSKINMYIGHNKLSENYAEGFYHGLVNVLDGCTGCDGLFRFEKFMDAIDDGISHGFDIEQTLSMFADVCSYDKNDPSDPNNSKADTFYNWMMSDMAEVPFDFYVEAIMAANCKH